MRFATGEVTALIGEGLPLGLRDGSASKGPQFEFPAGSHIVLYTDGLTELGFRRNRCNRRLRCAQPVLHVLDSGIGFHYNPTQPNDIYRESGRGLYLSSLFSEGFHVERRPGGGSHARAVLSKSF